MKRKSNLGRKYELYRAIPFLVPMKESSDPCVDTQMKLETIFLVRPNVMYKPRLKELVITQRMPSEQKENEGELVKELIKEVKDKFSTYRFENIIIEISYNE